MSNQSDQITVLHQTCLDLSLEARKKADGLRILNVFLNLLLILSGATISITSAIDDAHIAQWIGVSLGLLITISKSVSSIFNLEQKATIYKQISTRARTLARNALELTYKEMNDRDLLKEIHKIYANFDELDMWAFSTGNGPFKKTTPVSSGKSSPQI